MTTMQLEAELEDARAERAAWSKLLRKYLVSGKVADRAAYETAHREHAKAQIRVVRAKRLLAQK